MIYFIIFLAVLGPAVFITPPTRRLAFRLGIVAQPGGRRQHTGLIPKLGGVPIMIAYLLGIGLVYWLLPPQAGSNDALRLRGVILGTLIIFIGGLIDDRLELSARWQFAFQIVAAIIAMSHIIFIERFTNPFPSTDFWQGDVLSIFFTLEGEIVVIQPFLVYLITLFWVLGMINAVNWLDGLDGLAGGVGTIAALMFALHSYRLSLETGQTAVTLFRAAQYKP